MNGIKLTLGAIHTTNEDMRNSDHEQQVDQVFSQPGHWQTFQQIDNPSTMSGGISEPMNVEKSQMSQPMQNEEMVWSQQHDSSTAMNSNMRTAATNNLNQVLRPIQGVNGMRSGRK